MTRAYTVLCVHEAGRYSRQFVVGIDECRSPQVLISVLRRPITIYPSPSASCTASTRGTIQDFWGVPQGVRRMVMGTKFPGTWRSSANYTTPKEIKTICCLRSRTEIRPTALPWILPIVLPCFTLTLTLTYDLDFQSPASYGHDPYRRINWGHRSGGPEDRMETGGRTRPIAVSSLLVRSVIIFGQLSGTDGGFTTLREGAVCPHSPWIRHCNVPEVGGMRGGRRDSFGTQWRFWSVTVVFLSSGDFRR